MMSESQGNSDSPIQDESIGAGDILKSENVSKQIPLKKGVPPPVKPRPSTARGPRTPAANGSASNSTRPLHFNELQKLECRSDTQNISLSKAQEEPADLPSTSKAVASGKSNLAGTTSFADRVSEEERIVGEQGRILMNIFIQERAENTPQEPIIREVCQADKNEARRAGFSDDSLSDIATTLRRIGDDISRNVELNNFIEQVPVHSTKEIFMKVCMQIFHEGDLNWGRVVALFYFAYRLIVRTLSRGMDSVPWVRDMLSWAGDVLVKYVSRWILSRGGWKMINEWFGPSNRTMMLLCVASITFGLWAYFRKL